MYKKIGMVAMLALGMTLAGCGLRLSQRHRQRKLDPLP